MELHIFYNGYRLKTMKSPSGGYRMDALSKLPNSKLWDISNPTIYKELLETQFLSNCYNIIESSCCPYSTHNFPTFIKIDDYDKIIQNFDKKIYLAEDIHDYTHAKYHSTDYTDLAKWMTRNKIQHIASFVDNWEWVALKKKIFEYYPECNAHIIPHHINNEIFYDYKLQKKWDIFMYGSCYGPYKFRIRLSKLLRKSDLHFHILPNPGDFQRDPKRSGENLAKMINQSWLAIATPSEYDYLVAKYFEISACNTVVVGNMANSGRHIWNDNFIEINEKMSDIEIIETIKKALNDKKMIKDKAKIMYELIQTEYNMIKYAEKIKKILNKI